MNFLINVHLIVLGEFLWPSNILILQNCIPSFKVFRSTTLRMMWIVLISHFIAHTSGNYFSLKEFVLIKSFVDQTITIRIHMWLKTDITKFSEWGLKIRIYSSRNTELNIAILSNRTWGGGTTPTLRKHPPLVRPWQNNEHWAWKSCVTNAWPLV